MQSKLFPLNPKGEKSATMLPPVLTPIIGGSETNTTNKESELPQQDLSQTKKRKIVEKNEMRKKSKVKVTETGRLFILGCVL